MIVTYGLGARGLLVTFGLGVGTTGTVDLEPIIRALFPNVLTFAGLRQRVFSTDAPRPIIGSLAAALGETDKEILGFHFDRKRWTDAEDIRTVNPGYIGSITGPVTEQTILDYWQSGIGVDPDIKVEDLVINRFVGEDRWAPEIFNGEYFIRHENFYFYGDGHVMHPLIHDFSTRFDETTDYIELEAIPDSSSPIVVGIYRRESDLSAFPWRVYKEVPSFTGNLLSPGAREDTINDDGTPDYTKVDSFNRYESYLDVNTNRLYLNSNWARQIGFTDPAYIYADPDNVELLELMGISDGEANQIYYSRYFPVDPGRTDGIYTSYDHVVFVDDQLWSVASNNTIGSHTEDDEVYQIDFDLGIVKFGGYELDGSLFLSAELGISEDECFVIGDIDLLPDKGTILIDSERMFYSGKTTTSLVGLLRGTQGTTPSLHASDAEVQLIASGKVPPASANIRIGYRTTPRIEYLPQYGEKEAVADDINVRPTFIPEGNGILYLTRVPLGLDHITLEVDKPLIREGLYGPVILGADAALLTATAYTASDEPVAKLQLTIEQTSAPPFIGLLNGAPNDYTSLTNLNGQITASYIVGSDLSQILLTTTSFSSASGLTEISLPGDYSDIILDQVYIYVITKDDPMQGTVGLLATYDSGSLSGSSPLPGASMTLDVTTMHNYPVVVIENIFPDGVFDGGTIDIHKTDNTVVSGTIKYWRDSTVHIEETLVVTDPEINFVVLNKPTWLPWNSSTLNGKKRVLYRFSMTAINPVTNTVGAYFPIVPVDSSYDPGSDTTTFLFPGMLAQPDPDDVENNVGGYMLTIPRIVTFRAKGRDPLSGRIIVSNSISLKNTLPEYLTGVYLNNNARIPYGWRLRDDELSAASGLDGATFVTINPVSGFYGAIANPFGTMIHLISI